MRILCVYTVLLFAVLVIYTTHHVNGYECSSCRYTTWNCPSRINSTKASDTMVKTNGETPEAPIQVCNTLGQIQIDDVFCDSPECTCVKDKHCISLVLGCHNVFQAHSRKRCLGTSAIEYRFQQCAVAQRLVDDAIHSTNMSSDWIYFKEPNQCFSSDCEAVRLFHECNVVQCGYLIVAWRIKNTFHLIVDGSRASDMVGGTFHFTMDLSGPNKRTCAAITSTLIKKCYSFQTRNQKETCDGIYLQLDQTLHLKGEEYNFSKLSWPVWMAVVGSIVIAIAALVMVGVIYVRMRKTPDESEHDMLLLNKTSVDSTDESSQCAPLVSSSSQTRIQITDVQERGKTSPKNHTSSSSFIADTTS